MDIKQFIEDYNVVEILGKVAVAIAILVVTWLVAMLVKKAFAKLVGKVGFLQKSGADGESLGSSIGSIASLLVWLFGLMAILQLFGLTQVLAPLQGMLNKVFDFLPNIIAAGLVFVVGAILAKIVRALIETALGTVPFDKWIGQGSGRLEQTVGVSGSSTRESAYATEGTHAADSGGGFDAQSIVKMIGLVVYSLIMIVVAIAALQILNIRAISEPATSMLNTIMDAIPNIIAAGILLAIGVLIAKFVASLLGELLGGLGIDNSLRSMDVLPADKSAVPAITKVVQIAIVLVFAVAATKLLEFPQITNFLEEILSLGGRVVFGAAIIAAGFVVANVLSKLASGSASTVIKVATLVLFGAMGLKYMGIADSIINLAFGALVVGGAAAAALAFGLGGREAASRQLQKLESKAQQSSSQPGSTPPGSTL